jgi:2-keto-4-pentenoate hydratase
MRSWDRHKVTALADLLVAARNTGQLLATQELAIPPDIAAALDVQAEVLALMQIPVLGWKVAIGPGAEPIAAPIGPIANQSTDRAEFRWQPQTCIEVELALRLSGDIEPRPDQQWNRDEIISKIDSVWLGIEITGGRLLDGSSAPFPLFLADSLDNAGYLIGPQLKFEILDRVERGLVSLSIDGAASWKGMAAHANGDPLKPLLAVANARKLRLGGLRAGQIVTTGALCGVIPVPRPCPISVTFDQTATLHLTIR